MGCHGSGKAVATGTPSRHLLSFALGVFDNIPNAAFTLYHPAICRIESKALYSANSSYSEAASVVTALGWRRL
jgi:hypothetical protein